MTQPDPTRVAFDDVVIDLSGHRLLRAGVQQTLEPKAFGVLALLTQAPGRVFTRDEIMDAVWGHRHVTPGVLNRVMTLLRHALGEDARGSHYLHTLHGVGYRFDLPPPADAAAPSPSPLPSRRSWPRALWLLPLLVLLMAGGWWWSRAQPAIATTAVTATTRTTPPSLVIVPLKPIGDNESTRTIADGLSEELIGSVARVEGLRVIARESTRLATAESRDPSQLASKLGVTHVLEGSLQQAGQALRIHVRLLDARGNMLWSKDFDRDASDVLALERQIAESVATSLTLKLGLATMPGKSGDAEFLRRFLAAQKRLYDGSLPLAQRVEPAETEYRALLRERPDDARVHGALAILLNYRATYDQKLPVAVRDEALQEATIAQRIDPSLAEPYFVQAFIACTRNQWESCVSLMHEADVRGMKTPPLANPAVVLARLGYLDRAEVLAREQVARDPLNGNTHFTLGRVLDTLGRHEEAKTQFAVTRNAADFTHYGHWFNAYWRKDYTEAGALVEKGLAQNDPNWPKLMPGYVATMRALTGQGSWADVDAENEKFERDTGLFALLRMIEPDAPTHASELIAGLERMRKGSYSTWDLVLWEKEFAFLRRDPAFQTYLRDNGILAYWKRHGFPKQCRPQGDGAFCE